ncbi:universal stress protein [Natrialbaceae archaeon A-arb3/5]
MHYLVGTESVHTTAAICDYLDERLAPSDTVTVVAVVDSDEPSVRRDRQEALNVAPVRLAAAGAVETEVRDGTPADTLLDVADEEGIDEIVLGTQRWDGKASDSIGSTARAVLSETTRPVVLIPNDDP